MRKFTCETIPLPQTGQGVPADTVGSLPGAVADQRECFREAALPLLDGLYRCAVRMTRDENDAEDLVHDTLVRVYRSLHTFEQGASFRVWAFRVLADTFADEYQQRSAKRPYAIDHEVAESPTPDFEHGVLCKLHHDTVLAAIDRLPFRYRIALILSDVEGFRYQDIAKITGCPFGTVRLRISRARRLLRRHLGGLST